MWYKNNSGKWYKGNSSAVLSLNTPFLPPHKKIAPRTSNQEKKHIISLNYNASLTYFDKLPAIINIFAFILHSILFSYACALWFF